MEIIINEIVKNFFSSTVKSSLTAFFTPESISFLLTSDFISVSGYKLLTNFPVEMFVSDYKVYCIGLLIVIKTESLVPRRNLH